MAYYFKYRLISIAVLLSVFLYGATVCANPAKNVRYYRVSNDRIVIYYDLVSTDPAPISVVVLLDGGESFPLKPESLSGDVGDAVAPGTYKRIEWEVSNKSLPDDVIIKVVTDGGMEPLLPEAEDIEKTITAYNAQTPIKLDGLLNEPSWKNAQVVSDFTQRELTEGAPPTEKTEVRVIYDNENIYIGVICYDSEPDKIIHKEQQWDGELMSDDMFVCTIDTYNDKRLGMFLAINPNGARLDATFRNGDRITRINDEWNGIWDAAARIMDYGWSGEIVIPLKTLRFPATDTQTWGMDFMRIIQRKNEEVLWSSWKRNDGILQLSKAGKIFINEPLKRSFQFDVKPYVSSGVEKELGSDINDVFKYGLDVKCGITSNSILTLTTKTDFAQIESDKETINLTRFDVRYPEKRDFFLEGSETFRFTQGRSNLFYSRTIGLNPDRGMVPILGGAKLTQKSGSYRIGLMTMLTEEMDGVPLASHSVLRVRKDVLDQSYIGFIATNLSDDSGHNNQLYGGDFSYNTDKFLQDKNLEVQGSVAGTITDGEKENNLSSRIALRFSSDLIYLYNVYQFTDEKFNQEMGYIYRTGVRNNYGYWRITPRPNLPFIKKFVIQPIQYEFFTDMRGKLLTRHLKFEPLGFIFNSNDELHFLISNQYEYLEEDYNIFEDVMIPSGGYEWWYYELKFQGNKRRPISFNMGTQYRDGAMTGDYYNGTKAAVRGECIFKVNQYYAFSADIGYSDVSVGSHRFKAQEYSGRVIIDFSTRLSSKTFVQWNNETNEININFRLHYIPKIGSDVYVVYNHLFDEANNYSSLYNTGVFKVDYTNRF